MEGLYIVIESTIILHLVVHYAVGIIEPMYYTGANLGVLLASPSLEQGENTGEGVSRNTRHVVGLQSFSDLYHECILACAQDLASQCLDFRC